MRFLLAALVVSFGLATIGGVSAAQNPKDIRYAKEFNLYSTPYVKAGTFTGRTWISRTRRGNVSRLFTGCDNQIYYMNNYAYNWWRAHAGMGHKVHLIMLSTMDGKWHILCGFKGKGK